MTWISKKLEDIATLRGGGTPSRSVGTYFGNYIDWVTPRDLPSIGKVQLLGKVAGALSELGLAKSSATRIPTNSVLFSSRASIGKIAVTDRECATNQGFANFVPKRNVIDTWFLAYLLCRYTPEIIRLAGETTFKEVSRAKLRQLTVKIPDTLKEQRRIARRIKEMMARLDEVECLASTIPEELNELKRCLVLGEFTSQTNSVCLEELVEWVQTSEQVKPHHDYVFAGIKSFGKGMFIRGKVNSDDFAYKSVRRLRSGDFVFPKLMAWEGAFAMVSPEFQGMVVSPEFVVFRPKTASICSEVLDTYFRSPTCLDDVRNASTGSNRRRRRLNPRPFLSLTLPVPSLQNQQKLKALYELESKAGETWRTRNDALQVIRDGLLRKAFAGEL